MQTFDFEEYWDNAEKLAESIETLEQFDTVWKPLQKSKISPELYVAYLKLWFLFTNKEVPNARNWLGDNVPFGTTTAKNQIGLTLGQIRGILVDNKFRPATSRKVDVFCHEFMDSIGFNIAVSRDNKYINSICKGCNTEQTIHYDMFYKWSRDGKKYCSSCRQASGKIKEISYYEKIYSLGDNWKVLKVQNRESQIMCKGCNTTVTYSDNHLKTHTGTIVCLVCNPEFQKTIFGTKVHKHNIKFDSIIECKVYEKLLKYLSKEEIQPHKLYRHIFNNIPENLYYKVSDFYIPHLKLVIEVSSGDLNNIPGYVSNLEDKLSISGLDGIDIVYIGKVSQVEDIVRTYLKK